MERICCQKAVPLGQTKLKATDEETTNELAFRWRKWYYGRASEWYYGKGIHHWRFYYPRGNKSKTELTERMLDVDGFISYSDVQLDSRAKIELMKSQMDELALTSCDACWENDM